MKRLCRWSCRLVAGILSVMALVGCATLRAPGSTLESVPPRDTLADFSLEGRFSLRHEDKNYSGRLSWRHVGASNEVLLSSPFGQGLAEIVTGEDGARLTTSEGRVYQAETTETLTQQVLGYPLPLALLTDWIRGRAAGGHAEHDAFGRLAHVRQDGWNIDYSYDNDDAQAPPSRIFAQRGGDFDLRLRVDEWRRLIDGDGAR